MSVYIYQQADWPHFTWDHALLLPLLGKVRNRQGKIVGKMESLGFDLRNEATLETLTLEVVNSSEIEGEILPLEQVRSSIARRLGMDQYSLVPSDRNVDGIVDLMLDATQHFEQPLSSDRLFGWHSALFPSGRSGLYTIISGNWRDNSTGPMQVVSGAMGKEKVHFQAPDASLVPSAMQNFIDWFNTEDDLDAVVKAALAHLWLVTIHPFEDGNGRMARALTDMLLARADGIAQRFYSMSSPIRAERNSYYSILEKIQKGTLDVTEWLTWFLNCLMNALIASDDVLEKVLFKHRFWNQHADEVFNPRQIKLLNRLLEGFTGNLTTSKWAKIAKCSSDTALRDIQDLIDKQVLHKAGAGGRSTHYVLVEL